MRTKAKPWGKFDLLLCKIFVPRTPCILLPSYLNVVADGQNVLTVVGEHEVGNPGIMASTSSHLLTSSKIPDLEKKHCLR